jgi:predicted nucleic acid-binding protein
MTLIWNASPVIVLAKAGLVDRFIAISDRVIVPEAVGREICAGDNPNDAARQWLTLPSSRKLLQVAPEPSPFIIAWDLGAGESAVIALAQNTPDSIAVLDDLAARRCAQALGLKFTGTLGLVLMAKQRGIIPAVREALDAIIGAGLYIAPRHLAAVRAAAGE